MPDLEDVGAEWEDPTLPLDQLRLLRDDITDLIRDVDMHLTEIAQEQQAARQRRMTLVTLRQHYSLAIQTLCEAQEARDEDRIEDDVIDAPIVDAEEADR